MACEVISTILTFGDFLVYPTTCNYYFYLILLGFVMVIIAWFLFKGDEKRNPRPDFIAAAAVSSIVMTLLASIGTTIVNSDGIPMIQADILLIFIAINIVFVLFWIFKERS